VKTTGRDAQSYSAALAYGNSTTGMCRFNYAFLDESYKNYTPMTKAGFLINLFAGIAIIISCLGFIRIGYLFGTGKNKRNWYPQGAWRKCAVKL
jgi:hypothetical protein